VVVLLLLLLRVICNHTTTQDDTMRGRSMALHARRFCQVRAVPGQWTGAIPARYSPLVSRLRHPCARRRALLANRAAHLLGALGRSIADVAGLPLPRRRLASGGLAPRARAFARCCIGDVEIEGCGWADRDACEASTVGCHLSPVTVHARSSFAM
jgi:hypothetical protein